MDKKTKQSKTARRSFLVTCLWCLSGVVVLEFLCGLVAYIRSPQRKSVTTQAEDWVPAGTLASFTPGTVSLIRSGHCYLVCLENSGMLAVSKKCTHLGCAVPWVEDRQLFECPCHASTFDVRGDVLQSPAPRALDLHPIKIEQDMVFIDTGRRIKRDAFSGDQLFFAAPTKQS